MKRGTAALLIGAAALPAVARAGDCTLDPHGNPMQPPPVTVSIPASFGSGISVSEHKFPKGPASFSGGQEEHVDALEVHSFDLDTPIYGFVDYAGPAIPTKQACLSIKPTQYQTFVRETWTYSAAAGCWRKIGGTGLFPFPTWVTDGPKPYCRLYTQWLLNIGQPKGTKVRIYAAIFLDLQLPWWPGMLIPLDSKLGVLARP